MSNRFPFGPLFDKFERRLCQILPWFVAYIVIMSLLELR